MHVQKRFMFVFRIYAFKTVPDMSGKVSLCTGTWYTRGVVLGVGMYLSIKHILCKIAPNIKTVVNSMHPEVVPFVSELCNNHFLL
jgi:hypothetical protein